MVEHFALKGFFDLFSLKVVQGLRCGGDRLRSDFERKIVFVYDLRHRIDDGRIPVDQVRLKTVEFVYIVQNIIGVNVVHRHKQLIRCAIEHPIRRLALRKPDDLAPG